MVPFNLRLLFYLICYPLLLCVCVVTYYFLCFGVSCFGVSVFRCFGVSVFRCFALLYAITMPTMDSTSIYCNYTSSATLPGPRPLLRPGEFVKKIPHVAQSWYTTDNPSKSIGMTNFYAVFCLNFTLNMRTI